MSRFTCSSCESRKLVAADEALSGPLQALREVAEDRWQEFQNLGPADLQSESPRSAMLGSQAYSHTPQILASARHYACALQIAIGMHTSMC